MKDFKDKFYALLIDKLDVNQEELKPEAKFTDLGADSLDMVELSIDLEKTFNITIPDDDIENIITIGDAEEYLRSKINIL
ncbi:MAG: acyl carrier protein [Bacteroidia bacterium]|nr:acyl carrier protein [Bacteroidia bacterium]